MKEDGAELFLRALEGKAKLPAPGSRASVEANYKLSS